MNYLFLILFSIAFIAIEALAGGTRLFQSLPVYALLGVTALLTLFSIRTVKIQPRAACLLSSAVFFGYILVRTWFSPVEYLARDNFMMVLAALSVYLLTALHLARSKYRLHFIALLLVIALGQLAVGLIQFGKGSDFMLFGYHRITNGNRASGQYISPNHLAGYLEVVGILGMSLVFWSTWKPWAKILAGYVSLMAFAGVAITGSRGGYVSTLFCILVFCVLGITVIKMAYPERMLRVILISGVFLLLAAGAFSFLMKTQLVKTRSAQIFSKDMRLSLWEAAWKQVQIEPLTGTGSGTYLYYGRKFRDPMVQNDPIRVHNDYIDLLAEYGVLGALGFLAFLGCHLWNGAHTFLFLVRKRLQFSADWRSSSLALNIGCLCAVGAYLVHSVVDFNLHIPANALLMAFVFGVLANPGLETSHEKNGTTKTTRVFQFLLPALGLLMLGLALRQLPGEYYAEKARVALRDGKYLDAALEANAGIEWEKKNPDLYYYLGEAKRSTGDLLPARLGKSFYAAASDAFKHGVALFPQDSRLLLIEAWTLDALEQRDEAEDYFKKAAEWDPQSSQVAESYKGHLKLMEGADKRIP